MESVGEAGFRHATLGGCSHKDCGEIEGIGERQFKKTVSGGSGEGEEKDCN